MDCAAKITGLSRINPGPVEKFTDRHDKTTSKIAGKPEMDL